MRFSIQGLSMKRSHTKAFHPAFLEDSKIGLTKSLYAVRTDHVSNQQHIFTKPLDKECYELHRNFLPV